MQTRIELPLIDISALIEQFDEQSKLQCAQEIDQACRNCGFFRIKGHGIPFELQQKLDKLSREFFNQSESQKAKISMKLAGSAWRGWFPVGGELTSGQPDRKEGIYVGEELNDQDYRVQKQIPLHGKNHFPSEPSELGVIINEWFNRMSVLGQALLSGIALGLGMSEDWFKTNITKEPTKLFRIFHYPPPDLTILQPGEHPGWGVGEHTDYGLITILAQDDCGGLQVKLLGDQWIDVPAEQGVFIINIGDMLDRLTEGRYRSTPHRVLNISGRQRLSFPFFLDPSWEAKVIPLPLQGSPPTDDVSRRWDANSVHAWQGKYGDYLTAKVCKCFPDLFQSVIN